VVGIAFVATIQTLSLPGLICNFVFGAKRFLAQRILANAFWRVLNNVTAFVATILASLGPTVSARWISAQLVRLLAMPRCTFFAIPFFPARRRVARHSPALVADKGVLANLADMRINSAAATTVSWL